MDSEELYDLLRRLEERARRDQDLEREFADSARRFHGARNAGGDLAAIPQAVPVLDRSGQHVRDRLDPAVRVPGEPREVSLGIVVPEVVEEEERVEVLGVAEPERAAEMHARAFEGGFGLDEPLDRTNRHGHLVPRG